MSNVSDLDLNLETLFQPAWAQGKTEENRFEKFTGNEGVKPERRFKDKPGERRGPRREGGDRRNGPPRGGKFGDRKFGDRKGSFRRGDRRDDRHERSEPPIALPDIAVAFLPEEKGVEQLARQIKMTGRAYPLFQIAHLILQKAERYSVELKPKKKADGTLQPLFVCALDDSPWTSEDDAIAHVLKHHFATFYQAERTPTDPPKGVYTFVAQCGMSGAILGPPNYHDYQNQLRRLHAEKFSRMPFEVFKARVKIVKDEAVVKKWIEDQSFKTEYICLNVPEPLKLASMDEVNQHFRTTHKDSIIKAVESHIVAGVPSRTLRCTGLQRLIRQEWERQRHFPLPIATKLSQQFAQHGLQFFKVNKTVTHVSVARPQFLDIESSPVSEGIKRIVQFIDANPKCTRKKLIEALAPTPKVAPTPTPAPAATPDTETATAATAAPAATGETAATPVAPAAEGEAGAPEATATPAPASAPAKPVEAAAPTTPQATPEQTAVMVDLHWLIHQGAVLEFADGHMETAKKPAPKPPKPEKKPVAEEKPATEGEAAKTTEPASATEAPPQTETPVATEPTPATEPPASIETAPGAEASVPVAETSPTHPVASAPAQAPMQEIVPPEAPEAPASEPAKATETAAASEDKPAATAPEPPVSDKNETTP